MSNSSSYQAYLPADAIVRKEGSFHHLHIPASAWPSLAKDLYGTLGYRLLTVVARDERKTAGHFVIEFFLALPNHSGFLVPTLTLKAGETYPSLSTIYREFAGYEAEIWTMFGIVPEGHAGLRRTVLHPAWPDDFYPLRKDADLSTQNDRTDSKPYPFFEAQGTGIYQIPVGPVHAGIIEPGHFRFSVAGEQVEYLDAQLGYVHKGVEKLFETLPDADRIKLAERISGDSTVAHALAYAQAIESLTDTTVPKRAEYLRVVYAELERIANHLNDIGFIMLDTAFSFGGANGSRMREIVMQWNERLSGNRFLRGTIIPGGVARDITATDADALADMLKALRKDFSEVLSIANESLTLADRLNNTGRLDSTIAKDYGVTGVPLRALGVARDARKDHPYAAYSSLDWKVATHPSGDVRGRFTVRVEEVHESIAMLLVALKDAPAGALHHAISHPLPKLTHGIGIVEGWRGDVVTVVHTDAGGHIDRVKVRDTSFLNWQALPHTVRGEMVPDFPLVNKSWNLSYSGNDL